MEYFLTKIANPRFSESVTEMEDLLEKGSKLLHHNHYAVTLIKIKVCKLKRYMSVSIMISQSITSNDLTNNIEENTVQ